MAAPLLCRNCYLRRRERTAMPGVPSPDAAAVNVSEWACMKCGAALEPEEVDQIRHGKTVECVYCGSAITLDLFRRGQK